VEQIVIPKGQAAELLPRGPETLALQIKFVESYQLASEKIGSEMNQRLRILPSQLMIRSGSSSKTRAAAAAIEQEEDEEETFEGDEEFDSDVEDLGVSVPGGTSPGRLPVLPE